MELLPTRHGILSQAAIGLPSVMINSYHHQSVIFRDGGPLELAARSSDGITEATEFKNGKGLLLQFHPEITLAKNSNESKETDQTREFARALIQQAFKTSAGASFGQCRRTHLH